MNPQEDAAEAKKAPRDLTPVTVVVLGGNPIVGRSLEQLLRAGGYDARFLAEPALDGSLPEAQLLLLAPGLSDRRRGQFLAIATRLPGTQVPIIELVTTPEEASVHETILVLWPCPMERLQLEIEGALLSQATTADKEPRGA